MSSYLGIDPATLAQQYTQIDRSAKDNLLSAESKKYTAQLSAFKKIQTSMSSFLTQLKDYRKADNSMLANTATTSSDANVKVTAGGKAVAGSYDIFVEQLAQNHQVALSFDPAVALPTDGQLTLGVAGKNFSVDLSSLPAGATLADLAKAINANADNEGVNATVMRSGNETFLVVSSNESGEANALSLNFTQGSDAAGTNFSNALANMQELKKAQDSIIRFGSDTAIAVKNSTNSLTDVIEGVTLDLVKANVQGDAPVSIKIAQDSGKIKENVQKFIDNYSAVVNTIKNDTNIKNDSMARSIQTQLRSAFQGEFGGKTLHSVGIEFDRSGNLVINSERLEKALKDSPDILEAMLTSDTGVLAKLEKVVEPYTKTLGAIGDKQKTLQASLDIVTAKQTRHNTSMERLYQRYLSQFTQMQITMSQLESSYGQF